MASQERFRFEPGDEEPELTLPDEELKRRVKRLSQRISFLTLLLPCLIAIVIYVAYRDLVLRVNYRQNTELQSVYMTNKRIALEVKTGGFLSKTTEVRLDKPLGTIKEVSAPGGKELKIQFEGSVEPTSIYVGNAAKWEAAIKSALTVTGKM